MIYESINAVAYYVSSAVIYRFLVSYACICSLEYCSVLFLTMSFVVSYGECQ